MRLVKKKNTKKVEQNIKYFRGESDFKNSSLDVLWTIEKYKATKVTQIRLFPPNALCVIFFCWLCCCPKNKKKFIKKIEFMSQILSSKLYYFFFYFFFVLFFLSLQIFKSENKIYVQIFYNVLI